MASERMSGPDAAWLHMDRPENLMIVNTVLWFDTTPDWQAVPDTTVVVPHVTAQLRTVVEEAVRAGDARTGLRLRRDRPPTCL